MIENLIDPSTVERSTPASVRLETSSNSDMLDAVRSAVAMHSETNQHQEPAPSTEQMADKIADKITKEEEQRSGDLTKTRDAKGRFSSSTSEPAETAAIIEPAIAAPSSWSTEAKNEFAKLAPTVQEAVLKREYEMANGQRQYAEERQRLKDLDSVVSNHREHYQRSGHFRNDAEAVNHLFSWSRALEHDPVGTLRTFMQYNNISLEQLARAPQQPRQQFQQQQQPVNIEKQVDEAVSMRFAKQTVHEFEQSPPEHYWKLKPVMAHLLQHGHAVDLDSAYKKACELDPQTRAIEEQKRTSTRRDRQSRARDASLNGGPHGVDEGAAPRKAGGHFGDVAEDVRAAMNSLT